MIVNHVKSFIFSFHKWGVFKDIDHKYLIMLKKIEGDNQCEMGQCIKSISNTYLND
jgi:hypothetical protein